MSRTVAVYVSGHGFGHAVRSAEVTAALLRRGARVVVRTDAPRWLFPEGASYVAGPSIDVGVAQQDGLELDIDETRRRWTAFAADFDRRTGEEADVLRHHGVDFVLGDIPPLAFAAASHAGIPSAAVGNFGWDWIYAAWPGFEEIVAVIQSAYAQAHLLLRLPLHSADKDAFSAFRHIDDVPLITRRASRSRVDVRTALGLREQTRAVLLSFGAFSADGIDFAALGCLREYTFVVTPPLAQTAPEAPPNILRLREQPRDYVSLLAACDVVITKPGYGIVADCLANRVAVLYTSRGPFREYDVLAHALETLGRARFVPREDLLVGCLGEHLAALDALPDRWTSQPMNGADAVAARVLQTQDSGEKQ